MEGLGLWQEAWQVFDSIMGPTQGTDTLYGLMESQDYAYPDESQWYQ